MCTGSLHRADPDLEVVHELVLGVEDIQQVATGVCVHAINHRLERCFLILHKHALCCGTEESDMEYHAKHSSMVDSSWEV